MTDILLSGSRETIERNLLLLAVLVELVDVAKVGIVGLLQVGRDEEEDIAAGVEHTVRDVVAVRFLNGEVVDGRYITFLGLNSLRIDKLPRGVGIVVECELFLHAVLLQDKGRLKLRLRCALGNLHALLDIHSDVVGAEVDERKMIKTMRAEQEHKEDGIVEGDPLCGAREEPDHAKRVVHYDERCGKQQNVLYQRLGVGQMERVAEASAVFDRIEQRQPQGDKRHHCHKSHDKFRDETAADG